MLSNVMIRKFATPTLKRGRGSNPLHFRAGFHHTIGMQQCFENVHPPQRIVYVFPLGCWMIGFISYWILRVPSPYAGAGPWKAKTSPLYSYVLQQAGYGVPCQHFSGLAQCPVYHHESYILWSWDEETSFKRTQELLSYVSKDSFGSWG